MRKETIKIDGLSIGYRQKSSQRIVKEGLTATFCSGELTALIGRNGVGKSTLLKTLSAFLPPLCGEILFEGKSLSSFSEKDLSRHIGVVLTTKPDVENITVEEMTGLGRSPYTGFWGVLSKEDHEIVDDAIRMVGIEKLRGRLFHTLSDGERQKVMIAKALAQQTPIIFLDEPTSFLDFPSKVEMLKLLLRLAHDMDKTIVMSTHDLELAVRIADRLWQIDEGGLHEVGREEVINEIKVLMAG